MAAALPAGAAILNACQDRYRFSVGLAAALTRGLTSLLPATRTVEAIRHLKAFAPHAVCLTDESDSGVALPQVRYPVPPASTPGVPWRVPAIDPSQVAAIVFTSGSTGVPVPHAKRWGSLVSCVRAEANYLGLDQPKPQALLATVPPQHMYGFESSVLVAWQSAHALCAEHPFYPADIVAALARLPEPRILITTPIHLRALLESGLDLPATRLTVSATAPLPAEMAAQVEARFHTRLLEIYGSTETGQIAHRHTRRSPEWRLWHGVRLIQEGDRTFAEGGHIEQRTPLCDVIELASPRSFLLHGRLSDLVNIGGKRSSLSFLTHQLTSIPGVQDGAFFHAPVARAGGAPDRVAAAVVAPDLSTAELLKRLRERVDPVFLPRPLLRLARLPRNSTGKLPEESLQQLLLSAEPRGGLDSPHALAREP